MASQSPEPMMRLPTASELLCRDITVQADGTQRGSGLNPSRQGSGEYTDQGQLEGVEMSMGGSNISFFLAKITSDCVESRPLKERNHSCFK